MSTRAVAFFIGLLTFFGPAITYFFETGINDDDGDMIAWLMRKDLKQIYALQGMVFSGVTLMTASVLIP